MDSELRLISLLNKLAKKLNYEEHRIDVKRKSLNGANYTSQGLFSIIAALGKPDLKLFAKIATFSEQEEKLLVPKYYDGSNDYMNEILVLENLAEHGFQDFNRFACIEWDYASKCVEQLAIFHSLSIAFAEKNPKEFEKLTKNLKAGLSVQNLKHFLDRCTTLSLNVCQDDNKERFHKFISNAINDETFDKFCNPERRPGLIHGDFRPSNIMHKVMENDELQVIILDYQFIQRGNPLFDLMYFIACGSDASFRAKYFDKLLDHYYQALSNALHRLGVNADKVYSKEDFDADVKLFLPFTLMVAMLFLPAVTAEQVDVPDITEFLDGQDLFNEDNSNFKHRLNDIINDFMKMGVL